MGEFWSIKDVAQYLGVEYKTVYRLVRRGEIPAGKVGGLYRVRREDVDTYFERQKVAALSEAHGLQDAQVSPELKCSVCLRLLPAQDQVGGQCIHESCDLPICQTCWNVDRVRHCPVHRPSRAAQLAEARKRLAAGQIPVLVTSLEAKQRELGFISRFDHKVHKITALRHPLDGRVLRVIGTWSEIHTREDESARLMELLRIGYLDREVEQEMPLNIRSCYELPDVSKPGLMLEARVLSHLPPLVHEGFDARAANLAELLSTLQEYVQMAESEHSAIAVGLASPTGWAADAQQAITSSTSGKSFSHPLVLPVLVDLERGVLLYNELDQRLSPLVSLFEPRLPEEELAPVLEYVCKELRVSSGVSLTEVREGLNVTPETVRKAFDQLVASGGYQLEDIGDIGLVITTRT